MTHSPVWHPFTQHGLGDPVPLVTHAEGAVLHTADGRRVIDAISSWWVTTHGHCHPRIMAAIATTRLGEHAVEYDDTPIALHQEDLLDRIQRSGGGRIGLREAFEGRTRGAMIGLFLAVLELARQRRIVFHQVEVGEIELELNPDGDEAAIAEASEEAALEESESSVVEESEEL